MRSCNYTFIFAIYKVIDLFVFCLHAHTLLGCFYSNMFFMYEHFAMRFSFDFANRLQQLYPSMWSCWRFPTGQKESRWRDVAAEGASQRHRNLEGNERLVAVIMRFVFKI